MSHRIMAVAAIGMAFTGAALPDHADARERLRSTTVQGAAGRGYQRQRQVSRQPGSVEVRRGVQTNSGRGIETVRGRSCTGGTCTGGATHTTNDGTTWGRSGSITDNGDGTATYQGTRTGPNGGSGSVSGTISRTPPE